MELSRLPTPLSHRTGTFDAAHRVLDEKFKCHNLHGHTYKYTVFFTGEEKKIGYALDFKDVKKLVVGFIDDYLDHGYIANPEDTAVIRLVKENGWKLWTMSLNGEKGYCNPTVENIAKEIYLLAAFLLSTVSVTVSHVEVMETPACGTVVYPRQIRDIEMTEFYASRGALLQEYARSVLNA